MRPPASASAAPARADGALPEVPRPRERRRARPPLTRPVVRIDACRAADLLHRASLPDRRARCGRHRDARDARRRGARAMVERPAGGGRAGVLHDDAVPADGAGRVAVPARAIARRPRTEALRGGPARHSAVAAVEHGGSADARRTDHDRQDDEPRARARRPRAVRVRRAYRDARHAVVDRPGPPGKRATNSSRCSRTALRARHRPAPT